MVPCGRNGLSLYRSTKVSLARGALFSGALARLVLLVADVFHPVRCLVAEPLLDRDAHHRRRRRSTVPMLLTGRMPGSIGKSGRSGPGPGSGTSHPRREPPRARVEIQPDDVTDLLDKQRSLESFQES